MLVQDIVLITIGFGICAVLFGIREAAARKHKWVGLAKENMINGTKTGMLIVDDKYQVVYANQIVKNRYPSILNIESEQEKEALEQLIKKGNGAYQKDGWDVEISVSELKEEGVLRGYLILGADMTEMHRYEEEVLLLKDEAERAKQEKDRLLTNMSLRLRNPMSEIFGFSELILQQKDNAPLTQEYAFDIRRSAKKLLHSINDILEVSKTEVGKMEIIPEVYYTQFLLEDVSRTIANLAEEKGLKYHTMIDPMLPYRMRGAVSSIREILSNLMNNAVKYTQEGFVSLEVRSKWRTGKQIQLEIVVTDTGIGMKESELKAVFDLQTQLDTKARRKIEGAGLGIVIVKGLVEQLDGEIHAESEYGKGTKITICLTQEIIDERPVGEIKFGLREVEEKEFKQAFITTAKILVVDDNELNLKTIAGLLKKYDIEADIVDSGYAAVDIMKEKEYDMILVDHMMPGMDGVETMLRIREMDGGEHGTLPVIALTANTVAGVKEDMRMLGFDGCLEKPVDEWKLERMLLDFIPKNKISYINVNVVDMSGLEVKTETTVSGLEMLSHVDSALGILNCGGTVEEYYQVLGVVQNYGKKRLEKLKHQLAEKDYVNYTIDVHGVKNTADNIGAVELSQMVAEHEEAGKTGNFEFIENNGQVLLNLYETVLNEIAAAIKK